MSLKDKRVQFSMLVISWLILAGDLSFSLNARAPLMFVWPGLSLR